MVGLGRLRGLAPREAYVRDLLDKARKRHGREKARNATGRRPLAGVPTAGEGIIRAVPWHGRHRFEIHPARPTGPPLSDRRALRRSVMLPAGRCHFWRHWGSEDLGQSIWRRAWGRARSFAAVSAVVAVTLIGGLVIVSAALLPLQATAAGPAARPGSLYAFGFDKFGQLGVGSSSPTPGTPALVTLPGEIGTVTQVAIGEDHSLAVTSSGQLYAFGFDKGGQLGYSGVASTTPTLVTLPGESGKVTQVAGGYDHTLVVTSGGQLYTFGINVYGELGNAHNLGTVTANPTPTLVALPGLVVSGAAAAGARRGGRATARTPVVTPGPLRGAAQVAAGSDFSLVLTASGALYAFGDNQYGQLGSATNSGTRNANPTPTLVRLPGQAGVVTQVAAGGNFSLVVTSTGQLYAFGQNLYGQLGLAANSGTTTANPTPTLVGLPGEVGAVTQIAAGGLSSLVLTSSGQLYAFGNNRFGQLGNASNNGTDTANATPALVRLPGEDGTVVRVAGGAEHSLVVTSSGQLYGFGDNQAGELGVAANATPNPTPTLVGLPAGTTIDTVAMGGGLHSLAVVADLVVTGASLPVAQVGSPYQATLTASGGIAPLRWSASGLPGGLSLDGSSASITGTPTGAGSASVTVTVTDGDRIQASHAFKLTIAPASITTTTTTGQAPSLTLLSQSHAIWREGSRLATSTTAARPPLGTTFSFTLDQPARVSLAFTQIVAGRKVNGHCATPAVHNHSKPSCTRSVPRCTLRVAGHAGSNRVTFQGRVSTTRRLAPGRYALLVTATNAAAEKSIPRGLAFTIAR